MMSYGTVKRLSERAETLKRAVTFHVVVVGDASRQYRIA
jgi:hypothetical protein